MLSDEEKILIKKLSYCEQEYEQNGYLSVGKFEAIKEAVNLIEKQSKEIEELKEKNRQGKMRIVQLENEITARIEDVNKYFTPNDKIKTKIQEYKKQIEKMEKDDIGRGFTLGKEWSDLKAKVEFGQSLLEKE